MNISHNWTDEGRDQRNQTGKKERDAWKVHDEMYWSLRDKKPTTAFWAMETQSAENNQKKIQMKFICKNGQITI